MKKIFTLITATLVSLTIFAYPNSTKLTITTINDEAVSVVIDGRAVQLRQSADGFLVNDMPAGYHSIKIYSQRNNNNNGRRRNNNNNTAQMIYNSNVYLKNGYHTDITINRFGKAFVDEQQLGNGYYDNYGENNNDWNNTNNNYSQAMNSRSFDQLRQVISNERFENTKASVAKTNIAANLFTAAQAKQLVQLFGFDNTRLDIAKYLYRYTIDKNNYSTVYDAFSYSNSKEELAQYIRQYR